MPQPITIKTADELSMLALLTANKLVQAGENAWQPAPGVGFSIVGKAALQSDANSVPLAGFYLTIWVDLDKFTPDGTTAADVWAILDGPTYKWAGDPIRQLLGEGDFKADAVTRALAYAATRKTSFRTPGTPINWYPFKLRSGAPLSARLQRLANLATDADVAAADISVPRLNRVREAITTKARAQAILDALNDAEVKWDRALWRLEKAVEDDAAYDWTAHSFPNVFQP